MSYGIEILNNDDRIVIDLNYPNFALLSNELSSAAANSSFPGMANTISTDLIVARANNSANGLLARTWTSNVWNRWVNTVVARYYVIRKFDSLNPNTVSGYGFAVYTASSNVIFSSNIAKNFEIVTTGTFNSSVSNSINISFPSATTWYPDFSKYYCVINSTRSDLLTIPFPFAEFYLIEGYRYVWANSTHGRIVLDNYILPVGGSALKKDVDFNYMILKELS